MNDRLAKRRTLIISLILGLFDIIAANASYGFALWMRFDFSFEKIPMNYLMGWVEFTPVFAVLVIAVFLLFGLYNSIWRYVSYSEMIRTFAACLLLGTLHLAGTVIITCRMPASYYVVGWMVMFLLLIGIRVSYRSIRILVRYFDKEPDSAERLLIVGAGEAARLLIQDINSRRPLTGKVVCLADDNPGKKGKMLAGIPIRGEISDVPELVIENDISRIIIAIPSADRDARKVILNKIKGTRCEISTMPMLSEMTGNSVNLDMVRKINVEDLLGRNTAVIDNEGIGRMIVDKTILVTGGGGSIGSELSKQIASFLPYRLVIFDIYENSAYDLQQNLKRLYPHLRLDVVIGSVSDRNAVVSLMENYRPDMIFHAAAHKHVPLMETVPHEAIKNNVTGTMICAKAAAEAGVEKFVLISTDKAVNPTNIMGASKRLCEMVVKYMDERSSTEYMAVRFGNVLGSNGSVIPLFRKQIESGGPVTVTHPEITRFFMTIPEAVSLVLEAANHAKGGELFVLDMGEPVRIDDLARNMIELSGLVPDVNIMIEYTGLRPGEKLYEEIMMNDESLMKTENSLIYIGRQNKVPRSFGEDMAELESAAENPSSDIIETVKKLVPTYVPGRDNQ